MKRLQKALLIFSLFFASGSFALTTGELFMVRSNQGFPETMSHLQEAIKKQGYTLSRVQRVDVGLTKSGFSTDKYRVVFFAKNDELQFLSDNHPEIIPYLPLKIAIFAENNETILISTDPSVFIDLYSSADLQPYFTRWAKDLKMIFEYIQYTE
ncbi:MAG: DUF302 domain-containing protein [Gammaproteobacteria bacterium]|nr:DUF302 domain-containing protein [Gammaproteobacteria bacterium]